MLSELGIKFDFEYGNIQWENATVPMKSVDCTVHDMYVQDAKAVQCETDRIKSILEAKYEPANLEQIVGEQSQLSKLEKSQLLRLLKKYDVLFDGTLGKWNNKKLELELREGATPYHAKAYPIPKIHEKTLKIEVDRLV